MLNGPTDLSFTASPLESEIFQRESRAVMVKEAKHPKREHPCPHCLTGFRSPSERDRHARAVHEKWRDYKCPHCSGLFASGSRTVC